MRGTITRLSRLEAKRSPKADTRFYVFGLDEDDAAERYAAEIRAGTVQRGDPCTTLIWRSAGPLPAPRWAVPSDLTDDELHDALHHLALMSGRELLPRDADSAALAAEISTIRQELGP
ncbi:hypothetical protein [Methylobacterium soli]|uniref:Uncharacterized protein n=1 Tax=Methylobacterium soli TaxID=553447 RepID=A0A6L3SSY8_9HYPH|nr:hypothetical protein [Methylobacterium soli]KAB1070797.1 hypothetical protein F6X53_29675 [Methylobacterium soli]GJE42424.1 hypothetical protein AEGHOMDF_1596 [Methylobacterium soli]